MDALAVSAAIEKAARRGYETAMKGAGLEPTWESESPDLRNDWREIADKILRVFEEEQLCQ